MSPPFAKCRHATTCELYGQFRLSSALLLWQQRYCDSESGHRECARYQLSGQGQPVPLTLLPNGKHLPVQGER